MARGGSRERLLVGEDQVEALGQGRQQQVTGLIGGHVYEDGARDRMARDVRERLVGSRGPAPERRQENARVFPLGQAEQPRAREPARVEDVARPIQEAHDADARVAVPGGECSAERPRGRNEEQTSRCAISSAPPPPIFES